MNLTWYLKRVPSVHTSSIIHFPSCVNIFIYKNATIYIQLENNIYRSQQMGHHFGLRNSIFSILKSAQQKKLMVTNIFTAFFLISKTCIYVNFKRSELQQQGWEIQFLSSPGRLLLLMDTEYVNLTTDITILHPKSLPLAPSNIILFFDILKIYN